MMPRPGSVMCSCLVPVEISGSRSCPECGAEGPGYRLRIDVSELIGGQLIVPRPYFVEPGGVFAERLTKNGDREKIRVTWSALLPICSYIDPAGDQFVELAWREADHWITRLVPRSVAKSGRKLVAALGNAGLPVTEADAKAAERFIAAAEQQNRHVLPRMNIARQLGWQHNDQFATSQDVPCKIEPKYDDQRSALAAHHPEGTLDGWKAAVALLSAFPYALPGLYAGLAAALLQPLKLDSFTVDIATRSSRGKTISAMCGASCWFDPSDKADGMFNWRTTAIAAEKRLNLVNGLPVVIDETRLVKTPELVDSLLYQVPKNHGAPRGGGWPTLLPWRTIVISTGEQPALSFTTHEGASARVLSVRRAPFGTDGQQSEQAAIRVRDGVLAHFGTAGPAFAGRLRQLLEDPANAGALRNRHADLAEKFRGTSDIASRRAPLVACLYLAGQLGHEWAIVPLEPPGPGEWLEIFCDGDQDRNDDRPGMALDVVRGWLASHSADLWASADREHPPLTGWIGRRTKDGNEIAVIPDKLREALRREDFELDAVLPGWLEKGVILMRTSQRPAHLIQQRIAGHQVKCIVFAAAALDDGADEQ